MENGDDANVRALRRSILSIAFNAQEGHVPSAMSIVEPLYVVFRDWDVGEGGSDSFILSKGHGCLALYAVLGNLGLVSPEDMKSLGSSKGILGGHPDMRKVPGVLASTGSLGHGFPMAVGLAYSKRYFSGSGTVFALLGDGECNEGAIWEAALLASTHGLSNLVAWIDFNHSGDRALSLEPLAEKWAAFGFRVLEVDGHDIQEIERALMLVGDAPTAIIAHATKGKGVSFMENAPAWHHSVLDEDSFEIAMKELS
jgi:transketolase